MSVYILSQGSIFCVLSRFHFRRVLPFSSLVWNRRDMTLFMGFLWQVTMKFSSSFYFFLSYRVTSVKYIFTHWKLQSIHMMMPCKSYTYFNGFIYQLWKIVLYGFSVTKHLWFYLSKFETFNFKSYVTMQCYTSVYIHTYI